MQQSLRHLLAASALVLVVPSLSAEASGLHVIPAQTATEAGKVLAESLGEVDVLGEFAREINQRLELPETINLGFVECGEANAWYLSEAREVVVCIELVDYYYQLLRAHYEKGDELDQAVAAAFSFIVLHEVGHALVDVLDLPVTGREEDAVDQLAVWLLLQEAGGDTAVADAAFSFLAAEPSAGQEMGDEHALDAQRYFNLLCWVYGSSPRLHAQRVRDSALPARRRAQCPREYQRLQRSWQRLLAPAARQGLRAQG